MTTQENHNELILEPIHEITSTEYGKAEPAINGFTFRPNDQRKQIILTTIRGNYSFGNGYKLYAVDYFDVHSEVRCALLGIRPGADAYLIPQDVGENMLTSDGDILSVVPCPLFGASSQTWQSSRQVDLFLE